MSSDFDRLEQKIRDAQGAEKRVPEHTVKAPIDENARAGISAGFEFAGAIAASIAIGYGLDSWLGTKPLFFISFFFLGIFTGFYNVYRATQNPGSRAGYSILRKLKKNANKTPELSPPGLGKTEKDRE